MAGRFLRQTLILAGAELRELLTRPRIVIVLLLHIGTLAVALIGMGRLQGAIGTYPAPHLREAFELASKNILATMGAALSAREYHEVRDFMEQLYNAPLALWVFQLFSLVMLPAITSLVSADMITLDIYRGTLRYVLLRSSRSAYIVSKIAAHTAAFTVVQAVAIGYLVTHLAHHGESASLDALFRYWPQMTAVNGAFILCLISGTALVSAACRRPFTALLLLQIFWFLLFVVVAFVPWASPFRGSNLLGFIAPFDAGYRSAALGFSAWGCGFAAFTLVQFGRRNL